MIAGMDPVDIMVILFSLFGLGFIGLGVVVVLMLKHLRSIVKNTERLSSSGVSQQPSSGPLVPFVNIYTNGDTEPRVAAYKFSKQDGQGGGVLQSGSPYTTS